MNIEIKTCPSCGSRRIAKQRTDWDGDFEGKRYIVRDLEYHRCPACGECVFDSEAMRKIERARMKRTA